MIECLLCAKNHAQWLFRTNTFNLTTIKKEGGALLLSSPKLGYGKVQELAQDTAVDLKPEGRAPEPILLSGETSASPAAQVSLHTRAHTQDLAETLAASRDSEGSRTASGHRGESQPASLCSATASTPDRRYTLRAEAVHPSPLKDRAGVGASP